MTNIMTEEIRDFFLDKGPFQKLVREQNQRLGIAPDPTATPEKSQAMTSEALARNGLRPEDNIGSCSIIAARDGK